MKQILSVWKTVFKNWRYSFLVVIIALTFYILNVAIVNVENLISFYNSLGFIAMMNFLLIASLGFGSLVTKFSLYTIFAISIMTGMLISLILYKFKFVKSLDSKKAGFFSGVGLFLGVLVPGCATCGIGLAAVLGLGASLAVLPFDGAEISLLALGVIGFSIFKVSKDFYKCKISKPVTFKKKGVLKIK